MDLTDVLLQTHYTDRLDSVAFLQQTARRDWDGQSYIMERQAAQNGFTELIG
jgi:hypothetical protein